MSRTESRQGLDLGSCVDQVKGFVRDRCSGVRALLKLDKPGHSKLPESSPSLQTASATGSQVSGFPRTNLANSRPTPTSIGTPIDQYTSREELGRATWLLLHTLAAQYPDKPSKQQRKDVAAMVNLMTRIYPCGECAEHFESIVRYMVLRKLLSRAHPESRNHAPTTETGPQLRQWMCKAHNAVNQSLGKPQFNCQFVDARWGGVECEGETACVLLGGPKGK